MDANQPSSESKRARLDAERRVRSECTSIDAWAALARVHAAQGRRAKACLTLLHATSLARDSDASLLAELDEYIGSPPEGEEWKTWPPTKLQNFALSLTHVEAGDEFDEGVRQVIACLRAHIATHRPPSMVESRSSTQSSREAELRLMQLVDTFSVVRSLCRTIEQRSPTQSSEEVQLNLILVCATAVSILSDELKGEIFSGLGRSYTNRICGERGVNVELAIVHFEQALTVYTETAFPEDWARTQHALASAFSHRTCGERAENIDLAIEHYEKSLAVCTETTFSELWAATQNYLGNACLDRTRGDRAANIEQAIEHCNAALRVFTETAFPEKWSDTQNILANAYSDRICGVRADDIELAIEHYKAALRVRTETAYPGKWAATQNNLANAYNKRLYGERAANIEQAIERFNAALRVFMEASFPEKWALAQNNLATAYLNRIHGERAVNIEQMVEHLNMALRVFTETAFPMDWAMAQMNLAIAHSRLIRGKRAENIEQAIEHFNAVLRVYTETAFPEMWAKTQHNLASICRNRIHGERAANVEEAIKHGNAALRVFTATAFPEMWAMTQNKLANAYLDRICGERAANIEQAIEHCNAALRVFTARLFPEKWAMMQNTLANAYSDRIGGVRAENIEQAIKHYNAALRVYTETAYPEDWAMTQNNLAAAYWDRIHGERAANIEQTVEHCEAALRVRTETAFPEKWAETRHNLAAAYNNRIHGVRAANIEQAIEHCNAAMRVYTETDFPEMCATTQNTLAAAYSDRIRGERAENIERAIEHYNAALGVRTETALPENWAMTQNNLAAAYNNRIHGVRAANIEQAIEHYNAALRVYTETAFPEKWAMTQNNLAAAYSDRMRGERAENIERAIEHCKAALRVRTETSFPEKWAETQNNLAAAYNNRICGERAANIEQAIEQCSAALRVFTETAFPEKWAMMQNNVATAYSDRIHGERAANMKQAIEHYNAALRVRTEMSFPREFIRTAHALHSALLSLDRKEDALRALTGAIDCIPRVRAETVSGDAGKQLVSAEFAHVYASAVEVCLDLGDTVQALEYAELSKTQNLADLLSERKPSDSVPKQARDDFDALKTQLREKQQELTLTDANKLQECAQLREAIASLDRELQQLVRDKVAPYDPGFDLGTNAERVGYEQMCDVLAGAAEETAAVVWYVCNTRVAAFVFTKDSKKPPQIWQSNDQGVADLVDASNRFIRASNVQEEMRHAPDALAALAPLLGLKDVAALLPSGTQRLLLVPHRFLHVMPLHAVPFGEGGQCLLDQWIVAYAPSFRVLKHTASRPPVATEGHLAVVDPTDDKRIGGYCENAYRWGVGKAASMWTELKREEASRSNVVTKLRSGGFASVFVACHGTANQADPLHSGLLMHRDELLTLRDVLNEANLRGCELAALLACSSGVTQMKDLSDEWMGLPFGFVLAGCANVFASLWPVKAESGSVLVAKAFQEWVRTRDAPAALCQAAREVKRAQGAPLRRARYLDDGAEPPEDEPLSFEDPDIDTPDLSSALERLDGQISVLDWSPFVCFVTRL